MINKINHIVVVGGGSAGWIVATTLTSQLPNTKITVIESPNIPTVGVGESTIGGIRAWLRLVGIKDNDFMSACDASYKLAIKFNNFYKKDSGSWYYPFGAPYLEDTMHGRDDWFVKKTLYPDTPTEDYANSYYSQMALVNSNKILTNNLDLDGFDFYNHTAFHFDAAKLGIWLRDQYCKPKGVNHIVDEVTEITQDDSGIKELVLSSGETVTADLFVDCTGFKSLLLGDALQVPFKSYEHLLPNNRAWATRIEYTDKEKQLDSVTDCTALDNGWVWNIPLWSRIGTGYVYSDKFISPEQAKEDFITHLNSKGYNTKHCEFRDINIRVGMHEKLWVKNVVAVGLSAAFIEPLESTGLLTTHDFAKTLCNVLLRGSVSQWDRDEFNLKCEDEFNYWAQFVSMHYALSHRDDSEYWRAIGKKSFTTLTPFVNKMQTQGLYFQTMYQKNFIKFFQDDNGINCLAAGMNWNPNDYVTLRSIFAVGTDLREEFGLVIMRLAERQTKWKRAVETAPSLYQYLKDKFYS
jgi:tryptophan halogenase